MNNLPLAERCPKCDRLHELGEYQEFNEMGQSVFARPDIVCPCGLTLRAVVPLFKTNRSGVVLKPVPGSLPLRRAS